MIRSDVMGWATIFLVILFAFVLIPTHERFVDAKGKYTDVSPNAPPMPAWLNPGGQNKNTLVGPGGVSPLIDSSTDYSRTAPKDKIWGAPTSSNLDLLPSPTAAAPRITSTLGTADPSISGMNSAYTSGVIPPSGNPWPGLKGFTEMASVNTNPKFQPQTHPTPPLGTLRPTTPDLGLYGPGPNVLRKNLVKCTCSSQSAGCPVHR